jgi:two-component sensor histidine kinase
MQVIWRLRDGLGNAPGWVLPAGVLLLALLAWAAVSVLPGLSVLHAQLTLMLVVIGCSFTLGLATGLAAATLGFALLLWRSFHLMPADAAGAAWTIVLDSILWFAVAKLAAALIAVLRKRLAETAAARVAAEAEARRYSLREEELSHRFNNDMQMLVGLLRSEATQDPHAATSLQRAAGRLQIVGRVHRRLLGSHAASQVNAEDFLAELAADMQATMDRTRPIAIVVQAEPHLVPSRMASDIGLAANELVTNALKYAFPGEREGVVRIGFVRDETDSFVLTVADNGVGLGPGTADRQGGLGMRLLRALATQLGGRLDVLSGEVGGTVSQLRFPAAGQPAVTRLDLGAIAPSGRTAPATEEAPAAARRKRQP